MGSVTADDVVALIGLLKRKRLTYWIAGGWGIDALVGRVTREHHDLDLHIDLDQVADVMSLLEDWGYTKTIDQAPVRIEMTHPSGKVVDLHPLRIDSDGSGHGPMFDGDSWVIPVGGLEGQGTIKDMAVLCISVSEQIRDHCEFEPRSTDWHDMELLAEAFGIPLPSPYDRPRTTFH
jgi:lincosamide nucleotidyltransferase A/C/D/E